MTDQELIALKTRVDADDPEAMYTYAEYIRPVQPEEADKYTILSAQLGYPYAQEKLGDKYLAADDTENAAHYFKCGAKGGLVDCSVKLAILHLGMNQYSALHDLEELAESGVKSACSALAAYYKAQGNRKEANFWRSLLK